MMALIHRPCLGKLPRAHNQIRLPNHIGGIARRELLCNVEAVLIGFERAVAVAAGGADVADLVITDGEIALPFGVVYYCANARGRLGILKIRGVLAIVLKGILLILDIGCGDA